MIALSALAVSGGTAEAGVPDWPGAQKCQSDSHCYGLATDKHSNQIAAKSTIQSSWFASRDTAKY
jgi:hypothetical protein